MKNGPPENRPSPVDRSNQEQAAEFARRAEEAPPGLFVEFWDFLKYNKKWWLAPIILILLMLSLLVFLSGTVVAPFIYPLF